MIQFKALVTKELKEAIRDKRALMAAMIMALLAPVIIMVMSKTVIDDITDKSNVYLSIQGESFAPEFVQALNNKSIFGLETIDDEEQQTKVKQEWKDREITLVIPSDYKTYLHEGRPVELILQANMDDDALTLPLRRINRAINEYSSNIMVNRVMLRGMSRNLLTPFQLEQQNTASSNSNLSFINIMLAMYLFLAAFITGLSVAIDTSAGERERNVLELLLSQPVSSAKVVAAKLTTASVVSIFGVVLTLLLTSFAMGFIDLSQIGASFQLNISDVTLLISLMVPVCVFASIIQLYLAFQAKTFKEAQSTVSMLIMLPALVPFAISLMKTKPVWLDWLPISGQYLIMEKILKGIAIEPEKLVFVSAVTIGICLVVFFTLAKKLKSEKTVLALS